MNLFAFYFRYVTEPERALETLLKERSLSQACVGYFVAALGWVLFFNIGDGLSPLSFLLKFIIVFVAELTAGCFLAAFCGWFLDLFKVESSPIKLFVLVGSAGFIKSLLIMFALISAAVPTAHLGWLAPLGLLFVFALQLGYLIRALHRVYGLSYGKVVTAWVLSFVPVVVAVVLLGAFGVWGISLLL